MSSQITNQASSFDSEIAGVHLVPYFQRYHSVSKPDIIEGELLTRPQSDTPTEEFFDALSVEDQFQVLDWQIMLQQQLHQMLGALVSINIHNRVVETVQHRELFLEMAGKASAPTTFEFTETYPMPPVNTSNQLLNSLRTLGHLSALDDFGTGLNGMSLLTNYDFDIIKIDRSLIFDIEHRPEKRKTLHLMLEMLSALGKQHVVEGIESQEVFDALKEFGFDTFQGFAFGRPQPVRDLLSTDAEDGKS